MGLGKGGGEKDSSSGLVLAEGIPLCVGVGVRDFGLPPLWGARSSVGCGSGSAVAGGPGGGDGDSAAAGGPCGSSSSSSSSGPSPAPRSSGSRGFHGTLGGGGPGGASAVVASGSAETSGSVGSRRMYGMRSLSWKALWNLREIRWGRLRAKVRGPISASMMKGPEALGASGCLARSWVRDALLR